MDSFALMVLTFFRRQHGDRQAPRPQLEPVYQPVSSRPVGVDERYETRRETRNFGQPAPNVIVID